MEKPSSSQRTTLVTRGFDVRELEAFAAREGVSLESLVEAIEEPEDLSIVEAFIHAPKDQPVRLAGRYELLEQVGEGSFGRVFLARDPELSRQVAVKVMPLGDPEVAEREGKALAALDHPNVVSIHDHGRGDDYRYLVLAWLEGETLFDWCFGKGQDEILARYVEVGEGLSAAHRRGLVHRDFKANNAMINAEGRAVLVDFGLARNLDSLQGGEADDVFGALNYLAPERFWGDPGDARSDQFAFCVALWEALAGVDPFFVERPSPRPGSKAGHEAELLERLEARLEGLAAAPSCGREFIPKRLRAPLERGMSLRPQERWTSMETLLEALREPESRWAVAAIVGIASVAVAFALALLVPPRASESALSLPTPEFPRVNRAVEGLTLIAGHQPKEGYEAWSEAVYSQRVRRPIMTAWWSLVYAHHFEREGSSTGLLLAAWVTEDAAHAYELGAAWEAAAEARHAAADLAEVAGDLRMVQKQHKCAAVNLTGRMCR